MKGGGKWVVEQVHEDLHLSVQEDLHLSVQEDLHHHQDKLTSAEPGLHLLVIHQYTARVLVRRVFQTQEPYAWWGDLVWWVSRVASGRLVVMSCAGYASLGLRHARTLFQDLGAVFVPYLGYQTSWCWAFVKGGRTLYEAVIRGKSATQMIPDPEYASNSVYAEGALLPLYNPRPSVINATDLARWQYCEAHGAMGGLCDEWSPDPLPLPSAPPVGLQTALAGVGVVVTAGNRHQYLYHTLTTLLATPGAQQHNVFVVLGDAPPSTTQLLRLLDLNFTKVAVQGQDNDKLFRYYRSVFQLAVNTFPDAPAVIFLDEDVEVSPDFFSFMSQTLWLLHADPTIYCINAFSFLPDMGRGRGPQYVRRGEVQVSWGYAVTLNFIREALKMWPHGINGLDIHTYDYWLYDKVRGERECIYPEVSRLRHYGVGVNTVPYMHEYESLHRPLLHAPPVPLLNAALMSYANHETDFVRGLKTATEVEATAPCDPHFPDRARRATGPLVVFFNQTEADDVSSWVEMGLCAGLHPVSEQDNHAGAHLAFYPRYLHPPVPRNTHPLNRYGFNYYTPQELGKSEAMYTRVYYVGVPYSRYTHLKPHSAPVFDTSAMTSDQLDDHYNKFSDTLSKLLLNTTYYNCYKLISEFTQNSE
nr:protein O-linked-mannose beta-1,2-N-acetylglucosaminyltransferase 1-like [Cherax quadricarinatus]